jgi:hypothetical protein
VKVEYGWRSRWDVIAIHKTSAAAAKQRDDPDLFNFDWSEVVEVEEGCEPITIAFRNNSTDGAWKQVHYTG